MLVKSWAADRLGACEPAAEVWKSKFAEDGHGWEREIGLVGGAKSKRAQKAAVVGTGGLLVAAGVATMGVAAIAGAVSTPLINYLVVHLLWLPTRQHTVLGYLHNKRFMVMIVAL